MIVRPIYAKTPITPSYRINNLHEIKKSLNFEYIDEWIIVYDGNKIESNPNIFNGNDKIKEYVYKGEGISGNPQRNYALSKITNENTLLYYLDDDNIVHADLYSLLDMINETDNNDKIYRFNQYKGIKGNNINVDHLFFKSLGIMLMLIIGNIDTAMVIILFNLCKNIKWKLDVYGADGYYIQECSINNKDKHVYIDLDLCYCNFLQ